jgi:AcrR family transcriptional regulator
MDNATTRKMAPGRLQLLLETAAREFAARGFESASLNGIIRACGISKSSFYHFLGSKEALFDRVVETAAAALTRDLDVPDPEALAGPHFWPRVAAFVDQAVATAGRRTWYVDFGKLFYLADISAERHPALGRILAAISDWVGRVLAIGRASGAVREDLPATLQAELVFAVLQAMDRWSLQHLDALDETARAALLKSQLEVLQRLLAPADPHNAESVAG